MGLWSWLKGVFADDEPKVLKPLPPTVEVSPGEVKVEVHGPAPIVSMQAGPDRSGFYQVVRTELGKLKQSQVDGFEFIFKRFDESRIADTEPMWREFLAYMFATAWHETAFTMKPISEYGKGKGKPYGKIDSRTGFAYYGRGLVQLTWYDNYKAYGIERNPDRANDPDYAAFILIDGMTRGRFTGKKLSDYFNASKNDPVNARRIINGIDRAHQIAKYHQTFYKGLSQVKATVLVKT